MKKQERIGYIDFLKAVALTCIVIAHTDPPAFLHMIRNIDVPLMVILSSILAKQSYINHGELNASFYLSRLKRLLIPTWIFLSIYFLFEFLLKGEAHSFSYYILSFCLTRYGVGYVWIILIYIYSMLLIPFFCKYNNSGKTGIIIVIVYLIYEVLCFYKVNTYSRFLETTAFYLIPYGLLTYLGFLYTGLERNKKTSIIFISFLVFFLSAFYFYKTSGSFQNVQIAKYPPRFYYLSYGIFCSYSLLSLCERKEFSIYKNKIILFISKHSLWIYLWHVFFLMICKHFKIFEQWYARTIVIYSLSIVTVLLINKVFERIEKIFKIHIPYYLR